MMRPIKLWPGLLVVLVFALSACAAPSAEPTATGVPTLAPTATVMQAVAATATSAPTHTAAPTDTAVPTEVAAANNCVTCHTDKEQLISSAKPEEEKVKESEGAG